VQQPLAPEEYLVGRPRARDRLHVDSAKSDKSVALRQRDLSILGLGPAADDATIRSAFRRLASVLHPDRHPKAQPEEVEALKRRFVDVSAAYHRLAG
jgi:DnaJ-class molecular chaperone